MLEDEEEYSHRRMLVPFLFCVYPRSMDDLAVNRFGDELTLNFDSQLSTIDLAVDRLVYPTMFQDAGWRLIPGLITLFHTFGLDVLDYKLDVEEVIHPRSPFKDISWPQYDPSIASYRTFVEVLQSDRTLLSCIHFTDPTHAHGAKLTLGHTMQLINIKRNSQSNQLEYIYKNSYGNVDSKVSIPMNRATYYEALRYPNNFNIDTDWFMFDFAYAIKFVPK